MTAGVERVHIRCHAPPGAEPAALALRARLARTARVHLPGALRDTLEHGSARVYVERVAVTLDFDPGDYDDVTVASLWARRVGHAVGALGAGAPGVRVFADGRAYAAAALEEIGSDGALSWVFSELPCGSGPVRVGALLEAIAAVEGGPVLRALLLEDHARARRLYERMSADERAATAALVGAARERATAPPGSEAPAGFAAWLERVRCAAAGGAAPLIAERVSGEPPATAADARAASEHAPDPAPPDGVEDGVPPAHGASPADGAAHAAPGYGAAAANGRPAAEAVPPGSEPGHAAARASDSPAPTPPGTSPEPPEPAGTLARPGWWTIGGGLVLLWPWLDDLLASELPPVRGLPAPLGERMWALAGLLGEERTPFMADPLVRLLAGDDLAIERPLGSPSADPVPQGGAVLRAFAAALPGFADAPDAFLRDHLLLRGGLIEPLQDGVVRVRLEPLALDPILERLPYPLGPFRLDGTPLVVVERRRT